MIKIIIITCANGAIANESVNKEIWKIIRKNCHWQNCRFSINPVVQRCPLSYVIQTITNLHTYTLCILFISIYFVLWKNRASYAILRYICNGTNCFPSLSVELIWIDSYAWNCSEHMSRCCVFISFRFVLLFVFVWKKSNTRTTVRSKQFILVVLFVSTNLHSCIY